MYLQKVISKKLFNKISFLLASWRLMTKIAGSGSISQIHGSADPDPYQNSWIRNTDSGIGSHTPCFTLYLASLLYAHGEILPMEEISNGTLKWTVLFICSVVDPAVWNRNFLARSGNNCAGPGSGTINALKWSTSSLMTWIEYFLKKSKKCFKSLGAFSLCTLEKQKQDPDSDYRKKELENRLVLKVEKQVSAVEG